MSLLMSQCVPVARPRLIDLQAHCHDSTRGHRCGGRQQQRLPTLTLGVLLDVALHKVDGQGGGAGLALPQVCTGER